MKRKWYVDSPNILNFALNGFAVQLRRDSCDMDANPGVWYTPAKVGEIVARGPRWRLGDMTDGGLNGLGTVLELMMRDMKVLSNGRRRQGETSRQRACPRC